MRVDIGNALAEVATPGVPEGALDRLDRRVADAHGRIERGRDDGEFGYRALNLPETANIEAIEDIAASYDPAAVLLVGIGGSALGAETISRGLGPADAPLHVLDNVDPVTVDRVLGDLPLPETVVVVASQSGSTAETLANFQVVRHAMDQAAGDWTDRTVVTTGSDGPLRAIAERHELPRVETPDGVPGRFSALSTIGLLPVALQGHDVRPVLAGGRRMAAKLSGSLFDCAAYAYGAVSLALERRGATTTSMMPYADSLAPFTRWFAQLWAESLGKDGLGQTPVLARGATDQHSQLQLYRAGRHDRLVTLLRPLERPERIVPLTDDAGVEHLGGTDLGTLLDAEFEATEASLAAAAQPNVRVEVETLDAAGIGELLYGFEAACILAGELAGVDTFTQPAVDWSKCLARELMEDESAGGTDGLEGKRELVVD